MHAFSKPSWNTHMSSLLACPAVCHLGSAIHDVIEEEDVEEEEEEEEK